MSYVSEVLADSPSGYWRMNESSGQPQDSSGNGNNTTASFGSNYLYSQTGALASDPSSTSIFGNQIDFRAPDHATLDLGDVFTLECWAKRNAVGAQQYLFSKGTGAYSIGFQATNVVFLSRFGTSLEMESTTTVADSLFHHIVVTKNGASAFIYIDSIDRSGALSNNTYTNNGTVLTLGDDGPDGGGGVGVNGWLDEMAVYPTALSQARVEAHYDAASLVIGPGDNPPFRHSGRGAGW